MDWIIQHKDLVAARRGTMFAEETGPSQLRLDSEEDRKKDALSLQVVRPMEQRSELFHPRILTGYSSFRAVTYTVSIPMILELLSQNNYEKFEVIFGAERLTRTHDASRIIVMQQAIEEELTKGFVGMGGVNDIGLKSIMDRQASGQARFLAISGSVVHSKVYLLESKGQRRALVGSANLSKAALSGRQGEVLLAFDDDDYMWEEMEALYEALRVFASVPIRVGTEIRSAHLASVKDLPVSRKVDEEPITLYVETPGDLPGDVEVLGAREQEQHRRISLYQYVGAPAQAIRRQGLHFYQGLWAAGIVWSLHPLLRRHSGRKVYEWRASRWRFYGRSHHQIIRQASP
ncbi:MAG: phospholipase D family protein [Dehalococcoidia bacterium]|nr:phospholipase D family protein [Dehalococcoidia bacterium]